MARAEGERVPISYGLSEMEAVHQPVFGAGSEPTPRLDNEPPSRVVRARIALSAAGAALFGLAPHILHHAGPLAGAALFAGVGGSLLFGALGLLAALPFLIRLHRRHGWPAPAGALALMAAVFSLSTFVIGPAIGSGEDSKSSSAQPAPASPTGESVHEAHH